MLANGNRCELTSGVTMASDLVDINTSDMYVISK